MRSDDRLVCCTTSEFGAFETDESAPQTYSTAPMRTGYEIAGAFGRAPSRPALRYLTRRKSTALMRAPSGGGNFARTCIRRIGSVTSTVHRETPTSAHLSDASNHVLQRGKRKRASSSDAFTERRMARRNLATSSCVRCPQLMALATSQALRSGRSDAFRLQKGQRLRSSAGQVPNWHS